MTIDEGPMPPGGSTASALLEGRANFRLDVPERASQVFELGLADPGKPLLTAVRVDPAP